MTNLSYAFRFSLLSAGALASFGCSSGNESTATSEPSALSADASAENASLPNRIIPQATTENPVGKYITRKADSAGATYVRGEMVSFRLDRSGDYSYQSVALQCSPVCKGEQLFFLGGADYFVKSEATEEHSGTYTYDETAGTITLKDALTGALQTWRYARPTDRSLGRIAIQLSPGAPVLSFNGVTWPHDE